LVANVLLADKVLGEKKSARDAYGISVIVAGSLLALYGDTVNTKNEDATIPQFLEYFQNGYFVAYASCVGMAVIGCISRWAYMKWHQQVENMRHLVFVIISSGMGMFSTLCASVSMKLLKTSIHDGEDEFKNGVADAIVVTFFVLTTTNLYFMNAGLKYSPALYFVPAYFVMITVLSILCGAIFNKIWEHLDFVHGSCFLIGAIFALLGVYILTKKKPGGASLSTGQENGHHQAPLLGSGQSQQNLDVSHLSSSTIDYGSIRTSDELHILFHEELTSPSSSPRSLTSRTSSDRSIN
jgi:drug/metabolite transporter (DMT)-like permease